MLDILRPFGTFCVHFVIFSGFGIMYPEKSGIPGPDSRAQISMTAGQLVSDFCQL
jgi:hypothetical protein